MTDIAENEGWPVTHRTNFVEGPKGFTESFDDHTVDVLVRMGLIVLVKVSLNDGWQTKVYHARHVPRLNA